MPRTTSFQLTRTRHHGAQHTVIAASQFEIEQHIAFCAELNLNWTRRQASTAAREGYAALTTGMPYPLGPYTYTLNPSI